jgi:hypothetical protein
MLFTEKLCKFHKGKGAQLSHTTCTTNIEYEFTALMVLQMYHLDTFIQSIH